ncbi:MAG TPA: glycosyltransferase family 39 protein, partial [Candidatus Binatia bacterium]|nr:glycosyltransferase family 39 protein [Candidatus Binatia bacterium]
LVVAALYLAAALHGLGAADVVGDDEAREAGIVRDVAAGHWLWPRFNDELLPDKPLLYHWLAAVPCAVAGFSEAAVRLPSALAGAGLVAWTGTVGTALLGPRAGVVAAVLVATTPALFTHARVARPDVLLALLVAVALGLAFTWWENGRRRDASLTLAALGLATFAKGPVAPVLFLLAFGGFLAWQGELRKLPRLVTPEGLAALLVLGGGWYAIALAGWGDAFVREHLVGRYLRNLAGGLPAGQAYSPKPLRYHLLFYLEHLPAIALPWTPLVVVALWRAARGGLRDPRVRFLVCWALAPVVAFTPAEWKLRYYLLPSVPALVLLAAPTAARLLATPPRRLAPAPLVALGAVVLTLVALAAVALRSDGLPLSASDRTTIAALTTVVPPRAAAALIGFAVGIVAAAVAWRAWAALGVATVAAVAAWMVFGAPALEQAVARRASLKPFAEEVASRYPAPAALRFWGATIRPVALYVGRPVAPVTQRDALADAAAVIATGSAYRRLSAAGALGPAIVTAHGRVGNVAEADVVLAAPR